MSSRVGLLALTFLACAPGPSHAPTPASGGFARALPLLVQAEHAMADHQPEQARRLFEEALPYDVRSAQILFRATLAAARAGAREDAFTRLEALGAVGYSRPSTLLLSRDLEPLHGDPRWDRAITAARDAAQRRADPDGAKIVVQDVDHFWRAYDLARQASDPGAVYGREYANPASPALQGFFPLRIGTADDLARTVESNRAYYESTRAATLRLPALEPELRGIFHRLHDALADATFPDLAFVIGDFGAAGWSTPDALIVGAEEACSTPDSPTQGFSASLRDNLRRFEDVPHLVAHELAHSQQHFADDASLLAGALREGGAELVAEVVSGRIADPAIAAYGEAHEKELWRDFQADMASTTDEVVGRWLWGGVPVGDRPRDLGYFVGYRITRAYYEHQADKRAALRALLDVRDARAFLAASGYGPPG